MDQTSDREKRSEHRTVRGAGQNESHRTESFGKNPEKDKETGRSPEKRCASRSSSSEKTSADGESVRNRRSRDTSGTSENQCTNQKTINSKTLDKDSMNKQSVVVESVPETQKQSRKTPDRSRDSSGTRGSWTAGEGWTSENQDSAEEPFGPEKIISEPSPEERPLKRRETHENGSGPEKKRRRGEATAAQELNVQQGETSAPQLKDSQSPGQAAAPQVPCQGGTSHLLAAPEPLGGSGSVGTLLTADFSCFRNHPLLPLSARGCTGLKLQGALQSIRNQPSLSVGPTDLLPLGVETNW